MQKKLWLCSLLLAGSVNASNVYVVGDSGATIDIRNYMSADKRSDMAKKSFKQADVHELVAQQYPLVSQIPLASFDSYAVSQRLPTNFALVGTGEESKTWLKANYQRVRDSGALVVVIDAPDLATFNQFQSVLTRAGLKVVQSQSTPFHGLVKGYPALVANGVVYP